MATSTMPRYPRWTGQIIFAVGIKEGADPKEVKRELRKLLPGARLAIAGYCIFGRANHLVYTRAFRQRLPHTPKLSQEVDVCDVREEMKPHHVFLDRDLNEVLEPDKKEKWLPESLRDKVENIFVPNQCHKIHF